MLHRAMRMSSNAPCLWRSRTAPAFTFSLPIPGDARTWTNGAPYWTARAAGLAGTTGLPPWIGALQHHGHTGAFVAVQWLQHAIATSAVSLQAPSHSFCSSCPPVVHATPSTPLLLFLVVTSRYALTIRLQPQAVLKHTVGRRLARSNTTVGYRGYLAATPASSSLNVNMTRRRLRAFMRERLANVMKNSALEGSSRRAARSHAILTRRPRLLRLPYWRLCGYRR